MRFLFSLVSFLLLTTAASALTLEDAINLALQNNDSIKQQRSLTESARYSKKATVGAFLPSVDLAYQYSEMDYYGAPAGVSTYGRGNELDLKISYNLFNGFADWTNYKLGANTMLMQAYSYKGNLQDIILTTKTSYVSYLKARNQLKVAQETLELLNTQKRQAEVSYEIGSMTKADVLKVDVQLASTELDLLTAQIDMKLAKQTLERYIGRAIPENEYVAEIELPKQYAVPELDSLYQMVEDNRSEMQYAKRQYQSTVLQKDSAQSGYYPKLNVFLQYSWFGDNLNPNDKRSQSYDSNRSIGISASWNIFNGFSTTATTIAQAKSVDASAHYVSDLRKTIRLQVSSAYEQYFTALEKLRVAEVGVRQARENHRLTQSMYEYGEATTTELLDASVALSDAQNSFASANYDIVSAVAEIERAVESEMLGLTIIEPQAPDLGYFSEPTE